DGRGAGRGRTRPHHVGHRLAASQQVRGQSERRRPGRRVRRLDRRRDDAAQDHGGQPGDVLSVLMVRPGRGAGRGGAGRGAAVAQEGGMKRNLIIAAIAAAAGLRAGALPGWARARPRAAAPEVAGLGEIMSLQQMRHLKLWFAGNAANWELADYELDELKEGFDDVLKRFPTKDGVPLAPMVKTIMGREIPELEKKIKLREDRKSVV